ncbi:MAG: nucleotide exchange factor GrpE [Rhodospirillales bacterium]|nr:nucleotide exchange factor GrpE [Rhodospirillales bacterium]
MNDETQDSQQDSQIGGETDTQANAQADIEADAQANVQANVETAAEPDPALIIKELNDKLLRAMAEAENTRRIAAREKADAAKYAVTNFARDIVRVADNLGFAMMSVSPEARLADQNLENLYVGIEMTMKELLSVFEAQGIKPVPAEGQPFDHNIHEAVSQMEDTSVPANTVMKVIRAGFTIQDRLLRPAQVIVSTGGVKTEAAGEAGETAPEGGQKAPNAYEQGGQGSGQAVNEEI